MRILFFSISLSLVTFLQALTWSPPEVISTSTEISENPQISIDSSGNSVAVFTTKVNGLKVSQAVLDNNGWQTPINLFEEAGCQYAEPVLAANKCGQAFVLGCFRNGGPIMIEAMKFDNNQWTGPEIISTADGDNYFVDLAINENGEAIATWNCEDGVQWHAVAGFYSSGQWQMPQILSSEVKSTNFPVAAIDSSLGSIVLWSTMMGNDLSVRSSDYLCSWSTPETISTFFQSTQSHKIAMNSSGRAVAVWTSLSGPSWNTNAVTWLDGSWLSPVVLSEIGQNDQNPQIAINNKGDCIAIWERRVSGVLTIQAAVCINQVWQPAVTIYSASKNSVNPKICINDLTEAVAVWTTTVSDGITAVFSSNFEPCSQDWSIPEQINVSDYESYSSPDVSLNNNSSVIVAWEKVNTNGKVIEVTKTTL